MGLNFLPHLPHDWGGLAAPNLHQGRREKRENFAPPNPLYHLSKAQRGIKHMPHLRYFNFYRFDTLSSHHIYWEIIIQDGPTNGEELTRSEMMQSSSSRIDAAAGITERQGKRKHDGSMDDEVCSVRIFQYLNLIISSLRWAIKPKNPDWPSSDATSVVATSRPWKHLLISRKMTDTIRSLSLKKFPPIPRAHKRSPTTAYQT